MVLSVIVWAIIVVCVVTLIGQGQPGAALRFTPAFLLAAWACWMLFWAPAVRIDDAGVALVNVVRTVRVTWPAIVSVDTKYTLTLRTASRAYGAWAAPAPSRLTTYRASRQDLSHLPETTYGPGGSVGIGDVPSSDSGIAALRVRRQWEQLRASGLLDRGVEGTGVVVTWHRRSLAVLAVLAALTVLGAVL